MNTTFPYGYFSPKGLSQWVIERTRALPHTWFGRRLMHFLRRIAVLQLKGVPLDIETFGVKMRLYPYTNICDKRLLFSPQHFDPVELSALFSRLHPRFCFVDIGANIGAYSLFVAAKAGKDARVLAVEPQPDIFDRLVYNIQQNPFGTIKAVALAVADKAGELTLFLNPLNSGESSVKVVGSSMAKTIKVPALPLLDLLKQESIFAVDAMKIDVEGAEDLILEPFLRDAPDDLLPSLLIIEDGTSHWQADLPTLLKGRNYELLERTKLNLIFQHQKGAVLS